MVFKYVPFNDNTVFYLFIYISFKYWYVVNLGAEYNMNLSTGIT